MRRPVVLIGLALTLAGSLAGAGAASTAPPTLRSVSASNGHLIVRFTLPTGTTAGSVVAATRRAALAAHPPETGVKLREAMHPMPAAAAGVERWRTHKSLSAGTYYVEVSVVRTVGVTDCVPRRADCLTRWSNVLRVVVR